MISTLSPTTGRKVPGGAEAAVLWIDLDAKKFGFMIHDIEYNVILCYIVTELALVTLKPRAASAYAVGQAKLAG